MWLRENTFWTNVFCRITGAERMLLMNVGFWDKDTSWEDGMMEMFAERTPPMSVPRDSREEALLICKAKQSDHCQLYYLESSVDPHSWTSLKCTLTVKPALMMLWMMELTWPWSQPLMLLRIDRELFITSEGAELIWPTVRPTHWLPKDWRMDADTLGNFATSAAVTWKEKRIVGNSHCYRITD